MNIENNDSGRRDFIKKIGGATFTFTLVDALALNVVGASSLQASGSTWDEDCDNGVINDYGYHDEDSMCGVMDGAYHSRDQSCGQTTLPNHYDSDKSCGVASSGGGVDEDQNCERTTNITGTVYLDQDGSTEYEPWI